MSEFSQPPNPSPSPFPPPPQPSFGPAPLAALAYSPPTTESARPRPAVLTALAVASIVVACISFLASVATGLFAITFFLAAKAADVEIASRPVQSAPPAFLAPVEQPPPAPQVGRDGLPGPHRRLASAAMQSVRPLSPARVEQLDAALARAGKRILGVDDVSRISTDGVRAAITDHGEMFAVARKAEPPDYFMTTSGRLELYDDRAVFYPDDGSPPVRSTAGSSSAPRPLTPEQVQAVVKQVRSAPGGGGLNPAQVSGVAAVLGLPNQRLAQASAGLNSEPRQVTTYPGGGATIVFGGGALHLGPGGQILNDSPTAAPQRPSAANGAALAMSVVAELVGVGLAVFLLVAGAATLRDAPPRSAGGRRFHGIWAGLKIPLAVGAAFALCWLLNSYTRAAAPLPQGWLAAGTRVARAAFLARVAYPLVIAGAGLGCLCPVVVLLALRGRKVREFYQPAG